MAALAVIGGIVSFIGTIASAEAAKDQAEAEKQAAYYKARQEERKAMDERAVAQRKSMQQKKETEYLQSTLQARSAASGGGADDPTVIKLASDVEQQGTYRSLLNMWEGESRGRDLENQASLDRYVGDRKVDAAEKKANAMILGGIGGLFGSFAKFG